MPTPVRPAVIDASKYREVKYLGGRILQARELQLMQDLEGDIPSKGKFALGGVFDTGALMNVRAVLSGMSATLLPVDNTKPMLIFVHGAFEAFTATSMTFSVTRPALSQDKIYANFVVWRVTADGVDSTLADATLVDSATAEPTAEMGQLAIYVGLTDDSGAVDSLTMLDRNTSAIPIVTLEWQADGTLRLFSMAGPREQMLATALRAGMVTVSAGTKVASDDDARLSNQRVPLDNSVIDTKVPAPVIGGSGTSPFSIPFVNEDGISAPIPIEHSAGGLNATKSVYSPWSASLHAVITMIWGKVTHAFAVMKAMGDRITAIENTPGLDLSNHIGRNLGSPATHPAVSDVGFTVNDSPYNVFSRSKNANVGFIGADGNYHLPNSDFRTQMTSGGGTIFDNFAALAAAVVTLIDTSPTGVPDTLAGDVTGAAATTVLEKIKGKLWNCSTPSSGVTKMVVFNPSSNAYETADVPATGGGGVSTLGGDVTGNPAACTVGKLQGMPITGGAPTVGQALVWDGSAWAPGTVGSSPTFSSSQAGGLNWVIARFGTKRIAFGTGSRQNGQQISAPTSDWNGGAGLTSNTTVVSLAPGVINDFNIYFLQVYLDTASNTVRVVATGPAANAVVNGAYVEVAVFTVSNN